MVIKDKAKYNEYMRSYMLRKYHKRRLLALEKLGNKCAICKSTYNLEFDHINPKEKTFEIAKLWSYAEPKFWAELELCQILCRDCHIEKTKIDNGVEHGGGKAGKFVTVNGKRQACACGPCKAQKALYMKKYS